MIGNYIQLLDISKIFQKPFVPENNIPETNKYKSISTDYTADDSRFTIIGSRVCGPDLIIMSAGEGGRYKYNIVLHN